MEDNHILLMRVLKIHYKDRLEILDEALKVIKEYSGKPASDQNEYDITSLTLQSMLNDLPSDILKYFLTMVPLPKNKENLEMNKDDSSNIRVVLLKYLNEEIPSVVPLPSPKPIPPPEPIPCKSLKLAVMSTKEITTNNKMVANIKEGTFKNTMNSIKRPAVKAKRRGMNRGPAECKKLLDICAEYVVHNQTTLKQDYQQYKEKVWKLVNSNRFDGDVLEKLYDVIRDLNKKIKWMRLLEADEITDEIIREEYGKSTVFVKERHLEDVLKDDPFTVRGNLKKAIGKFVYN